MAEFNVFGLEDVIDSFEKLANIPDEVINGMLNAGADIIVKKQKEVGLRMGVHNTGVMLDSIRKSPKTFGGANIRYIDIYPDGVNPDGVRNAEVAFLNEYGTKKKRYVTTKHGKKKNIGKMPARPFMSVANEEARQKAIEAAERILHEWQESQ